MDFLKLAQKRRSVRRYITQKVELEKINYCLEAARLAPSACNSQPWKFIVIDDPAIRKKIAQKTVAPLKLINAFASSAPVIVLAVSEKQNFTAKFGQIIQKRPFNNYDMGMAVENFCLAAAEQDLGTCILGWFDEKAIKKVLNIPSKITIDLVLTLGYPENNEVKEKIRKPLDKISSYNQI